MNECSRSRSAILRVLGIDPGLADIGYGIIDFDQGGGCTRLVQYGVIQTPSSLPMALRLERIFRELGELIEMHQPSAAVVEELFFAANVKTAMSVAHGRAACLLATAARRLDVFEYTPLQIKKALTGHGRAGKLQVQMMVRALLELEAVPQPDHAADALGAALCHVHSLHLSEKIARTTQMMEKGAAQAIRDGNGAVDPRKVLLGRQRRRRRR